MSKNVLITGGSRGIGRATALAAARAGWCVAVGYAHDASAADTTLAAIAQMGGHAVAVQGDISREADVLAMFAQSRDALGPLSGFVNNAGIVAPSQPLMEMEHARLERMFAVNVMGAYLCAREACRHMARSRGGAGGAIVNVSSAAARLGSPHEYVDYAGSKGAVDTLTVGLAKEMGPDGIRVNAVRPGLIDTEIHAQSGRADRARVLGQDTPLKRCGAAHEVADAIVWLLSEQASYVTGALLDISGGR